MIIKNREALVSIFRDCFCTNMYTFLFCLFSEVSVQSRIFPATYSRRCFSLSWIQCALPDGSPSNSYPSLNLITLLSWQLCSLLIQLNLFASSCIAVKYGFAVHPYCNNLISKFYLMLFSSSATCNDSLQNI